MTVSEVVERPKRIRKPVVKYLAPTVALDADNDDDDATAEDSDMSDLEDEEEAQQDGDEEDMGLGLISTDAVTGKAKKKRSAPKRAPRTSTDIWLYDAFFGVGPSIKVLVTDWIESWAQDKNKAMLDIVQLLLMIGDIKDDTIDDETLFDSDLITNFTKDIVVPEEDEAEYLLIRKSEKTFKKNFQEFFRVLGLLSNDLLIEEGNSFPLLNWLSALSSATFRPFRHAATIAGMAFLSGIATSVQDISQEIASLSQQATNKPSKTISERIISLKGKKVALDLIMTDVYTVIFVHRYRDAAVVIRLDCLSLIADCITNCPEVYLESSQLRYIGWALSDEASQIRLQALTCMTKVCKPANSSGLRPFIERFKQKLIDIALCDSERSVRCESVNLLFITHEMGFLEEEDLTKFIHLIMEPDEKIRSLVAPVIVSWITQEYSDPLKEKIEDDSRYLSLTSEKMVDIKSIAQALAVVCKKWHARSLDSAKNATLEEVRRVSALNPLGEKIPVRKDSEYAATMASEVKHISNWINRSTIDSELADAIGSENIRLAVSSLLEEFDVLENYEVICDMLLTDSSATEDSPFTLSDEEESCLVFMLSAGVQIAMQNKGKSAASKKSAYMAANRCLIKYMGRLLAKFSKDYSGTGVSRLSELVYLCKFIDMTGFVELRMTSAFDNILAEFQEMFKTHQDFNILMETGRRLHLFSGIGVPGTSAIADEKDEEASLDGSASLVSLYAAGLQSLEDIVSLLFESLSAGVGSMKDISEDEADEQTLTEFTNLVTIAVRMKALAKGCNFFTVTPSTNIPFSFFAEMNQGLEIALSVLKSYSDAESDLALKFVSQANILLDACVGMLAIEVNHLINSVTDEKKDENVEEVGEGNKEDEIAVVEKCKRFFDICEAIATDSTGSIFQVQFSLPARFSCMTAMVEHYAVLHILEKKILSLKRTPTVAFKEQCWAILFELTHITVFEMPKPEYKVVLSKSAAAIFQQSIWDAYYNLITLVGNGYEGDFNSQFASNCLSLTGFSDEYARLFAILASSADNAALTNDLDVLRPLGKIWDRFSELIIGNVVGSCGKIISVLSRAPALDNKARLQQLRNYLDNTFEMMLDSIQKSIDLYLQREAGDLTHCEKLVGAYVQHLKNWPKYLEKMDTGKSPESREFVSDAYSCLRTAMMAFLNKGLQQFGKRVHEWGILQEEVEDLEMSFQTIPDNSLFRKADPEIWKSASSIVGSISLVNAAWRIWGLVGGSMSKTLEFLDIRISKREGEELESLEDMIDNLEQYLAELDVKPVESDRDWSGYFEAMDQLRKGATVIKKAATKKRAAPRQRMNRGGRVTKKRAPMAHIAAGGSKRKSRRISRLAPILEAAIEEADEEEEASAPLDAAPAAEESPAKEPELEMNAEEEEEVEEAEEEVVITEAAQKREREESSDDEFPSSPEMGGKRLRR